MKKITSTYIFCFFILTATTFGQKQDFSLWESISLEKKIIPKLAIDFKQGGRLSQNVSQFKYLFFDIGITYKITKNFQSSLDYRFINKLMIDNRLSERHRVYWALCYKLKLKPFILSYRHILQSQIRDIYSSENGDIPNYYSRSKITVKFELNRFTPYLATELYSNIIRWNYLEACKVRLFAGCSYKLDNLNEFDIFYLFQQDLNIKNPYMNHVIGIGWDHSFY